MSRSLSAVCVMCSATVTRLIGVVIPDTTIEMSTLLLVRNSGDGIIVESNGRCRRRRWETDWNGKGAVGGRRHDQIEIDVCAADESGPGAELERRGIRAARARGHGRISR